MGTGCECGLLSSHQSSKDGVKVFLSERVCLMIKGGWAEHISRLKGTRVREYGVVSRRKGVWEALKDKDQKRYISSLLYKPTESKRDGYRGKAL